MRLISIPTIVGVGVVAPASADTTPDQFTFTDQTNVALGSTVTSLPVTITGLGVGVQVTASVSGTGALHALNGGSFTASTFQVQNGNTIQVRHTASSSNSTSVNTTETIGGVSDIFTSTTVASGSAITQGDIVTITGTGFGSTAPVILAWDTFETGTNGAAIGGTPEFGTGSYTDRAMKYSTTRAHTGSKSALGQPRSGSQFQHLTIPMTKNATGRKLYHSSWLYIVPNGAPTLGSMKLILLYGDGGIGEFAPGWAFFNAPSGGPGYETYMHMNVDSSGASDNEQLLSAFPMNQWNHIEIYGQQSSAGNVADGFIRVYINNVLKYTKSNYITRISSSQWWELFNWCDGATNQDQFSPFTYPDYYGDEMLTQHGLARVIWHPNTPYTRTQLQVPQRITAYSNISITYVAFKGSLISGTNYVTVIDDNDNIISTSQITVT